MTLTKKTVYSVSYYVETEHYWQFAGEFTHRGAIKRKKELEETGHKVRIRTFQATLVQK